MFYSITGKIEYKEANLVVINCNGIGYEINCSQNTLINIGNVGEVATLFTHLVVQENDVRLFGFYSKEEKSMYLKLTSVSGVGPKIAIQILSSISPTELALAIVRIEVKQLASIKGIGKKTANRIILELKEKIEEGDLDSIASSDDIIIPTQKNDQMSQDAILALESLGMTKGEASRAVANQRSKASSLEELITLALRGSK